MERRRQARTRRRTPVEIVCGADDWFGFVHDFSASGAFIETDRLLEPGTEIELHFADISLAPQVARARVARRRNAPRAKARATPPGIGVAWTQPPEFAVEGCALEIEIEGDPPAEVPTPACSEVARAEPPPCASDPAARAEPELGESNAGLASPEADVPAPVTGGEIVPLAAAPPPEPAGDLGPTAARADVVLIDEGELGEYERLAQSLGARTLRLRWGAQAAPVLWEAPPRIVIVSARIALAVPLRDAGIASDAIGIAVCDSEASTLRARLRQQGYELAVQRSAHPATVRLLLMSRLYAQRERRREPRRAFGGDVRFRLGLRSLQGTLLELSATGGSVLLAGAPARGTSLTLRIASPRTRGRALRLPGVVVRTAETEHGALAALRFPALSSAKRARLSALLDRLAARGPLAARCAPPKRRERRAGPRVSMAQQALALDPDTNVARDVLFGVDLSLGGMRIEPHPRLRSGERLRLALQPPGGAPPISLSAEVARDEGERGLVLRFLSVPPAARAALERLLDATSEVERTPSAGPACDLRVVMGTLIEADAPAAA